MKTHENEKCCTLDIIYLKTALCREHYYYH